MEDTILRLVVTPTTKMHGTCTMIAVCREWLQIASLHLKPTFCFSKRFHLRHKCQNGHIDVVYRRAKINNRFWIIFDSSPTLSFYTFQRAYWGLKLRKFEMHSSLSNCMRLIIWIYSSKVITWVSVKEFGYLGQQTWQILRHTEKTSPLSSARNLLPTQQ